MATWNVRTLQQCGKLTNVINEMGRYNISVVGVAETHWTGSGYFSTDGGELVIYLSGDLRRRGVAVIFSQAAANSMMTYMAISDRLIHVYVRNSVYKLSRLTFL